MSWLQEMFDSSPTTIELERKNLQQQEAFKLEFAKLRQDLDNILLKPKQKKANDLEKISIGIQLLIFDYLGLINAIELDNTKKSQLLSVLFRVEGTENIRRGLSNIGGRTSKFKTRENLEFIYELFEKLGLQKELQKVEADLKKVG